VHPPSTAHAPIEQVMVIASGRITRDRDCYRSGGEAFTCAGVDLLITNNKADPTTKAFPFLGITKHGAVQPDVRPCY
jgi:hypothetical protein